MTLDSADTLPKHTEAFNSSPLNSSHCNQMHRDSDIYLVRSCSEGLIENIWSPDLR